MNTIDELFARAKEVDASTHDLASSIAIAIWREMNGWQGDDKDRDFIRLHAQVKRVQDEIAMMSRGIRLVLEAARAEGAAAEQERACKAICSMCRNDDPILKDGHWIHFRPNVGPGGICSQWCRAAAIRSAEAEEAQE